MGLKLAFQAFFKAFKEPEKAKEFLEDKPKNQVEMGDTAHLRLLCYLQESGRLIDFLQEDIKGFTDAQIGTAVRKIHQDCGQTLEEFVTIRPLRDEKEGETVHIQRGYDPSEIKLVGAVKGEPPYSGVLIHRGWKAHKRSLPKKNVQENVDIVCPAEVEVRG